LCMQLSDLKRQGRAVGLEETSRQMRCSDAASGMRHGKKLNDGEACVVCRWLLISHTLL